MLPQPRLVLFCCWIERMCKAHSPSLRDSFDPAFHLYEVGIGWGGGGGGGGTDIFIVVGEPRYTQSYAFRSPGVEYRGETRLVPRPRR